MKSILSETIKKQYTDNVLMRGITRADLAWLLGVSDSYINACLKRGFMSSNTLYLLTSFLVFIDSLQVTFHKLPVEARNEFFKRKAKQLKELKVKFQNYLKQ